MSLLDLPEELLQLVSKHFEADEWAQGPAQACRLLNRMHLPRIELYEPVSSSAVLCSSQLSPIYHELKPSMVKHGHLLVAQDPFRYAAEEGQGAKARQRIYSRFEWAGRRMGQATTSLDITFRPCTGLSPDNIGKAIIAAVSSSLDTLENLTCFTYATYHGPFPGIKWADMAGCMFTDWLLQETPSLEVLTLHVA